MKYNIERLNEDVKSLLGESSSATTPGFLKGIPTADDAMRLRLRGLLPEMGRQLIEAATPGQLAGAERYRADGTARMTDCGLYAFDIPLPDSFARLVSARMESWKRNVGELIMLDTESHEWQWSSEPAIAGSPGRPRAYLNYGYGGLTLTLVGSESEEDTPAHIYLWRIPEADAEGNFDFPSALYPALVGNLSGLL